MTSPSGRRWTEIVRELSPRDLAILHDLARTRLLTGRHVQRLHVRDGSPLTQARRTRSTLQRLNDMGLVHRLERRIGGVYAGSAGFVYGLATLGQRVTSARGPAGGVRLRRPWEPSSQFANHVLAVSEVYVGLRESEAAGDILLDDFQAEPACWRYWTGVGGERLVIKPDAFVSVVVGDYEYVSFIEVDLGTESSTVLRQKAQTYIDYWRGGAEQGRNRVFPKVIWIVQDDRRRSQVADVIGRLPADAWRLFQITLSERATEGIVGRDPPVRQVAG